MIGAIGLVIRYAVEKLVGTILLDGTIYIFDKISKIRRKK